MSGPRTTFYLDKRNGKWLGVCAGIADYIGIDVLWVRVATLLITVMGACPWTLLAYLLTAWLARDRPRDLYGSAEDARFWQGVRSNPARSTRDVGATLRDVDRRLADIELFYTSRNQRLADEIESLR